MRCITYGVDGRMRCSRLTDRIRTICFHTRRAWWRDGEPLGFCAEVE